MYVLTFHIGKITIYLIQGLITNGEIVSLIPPMRRPVAHAESDLVFIVKDKDLLLKQNGTHTTVPMYRDVKEIVDEQSLHYLGYVDNRPCYAAIPARNISPQGYVFKKLLGLYGTLSEPVFWIATKALHIMSWDAVSQFCGRCGASMTPTHDEEAKICTECSRIEYPRISPAVIAAIVKDDTLLLLNHRESTDDRYTIMAGFVEPGETLEQAVAREAHEEAGISINNIRYFGSQPWAFTGALMVGFTATYDGGELRVQESEIRRAGWYRADSFPKVSVYENKAGRCSITWQLMRWFEETYG